MTAKSEFECPPNDMESERYALGTVLRDNRCMDELATTRSQDFYSVAHQDIFAAMQSLHTKGCPIDPATVGDLLRTRGKLVDAGGTEYLRDLKKDDSTTVKLGYHAKIIKRYAQQRKLMLVLFDMVREVNSPADPDTLLDTVEKQILAVRDDAVCEVKPLSEHLLACSSRIDQVTEGRPPGLETPWAELNQITSMRDGQLIIAAARTSQGKSILGGMCALHVAQQSKAAFIASVEMEGIDIAGRFISSSEGIDAAVTSGLRKSEAHETPKIASAVCSLYKLPVFINDSPSQSIASIAADSRRLKRKHNLALIVVDYLQLLETERSRNQTRAEALGEVSKRLKNLAKELKVPVLALCQLNREAETQPEPMLSHLRESGSLEQDADQVWLFWRSEPGVIQLKIEKHRGGPTGRITLKHRQEFMRFENNY